MATATATVPAGTRTDTCGLDDIGPLPTRELVGRGPVHVSARRSRKGLGTRADEGAQAVARCPARDSDW
jgi:hypothetical protein